MNPVIASSVFAGEVHISAVSPARIAARNFRVLLTPLACIPVGDAAPAGLCLASTGVSLIYRIIRLSVALEADPSVNRARKSGNRHCERSG